MLTSGAFYLYIVQPHHLLEGMFFFLSLIVGILIFIFFYMLRRSGKSGKKKKLRRQFAELISHLAVSDTEEECLEIIQKPGHQRRIAKWVKDPFTRRVLIRELVGAAKNISGQSTQNIAWFYNHLDLDKDSLAGIRSKHWHIKARSIQQLSELQQKKYLLKIYKLTNDRHELVRNEARVAVVKMNGFEGLRFLEVISYPITEWEQICLLQELPQHVNINYAAMGRWLNSPNHSVVEFALRFVACHRVHELHEEVAKCLHLPERTVREKAILALKEIVQSGTAGILVNHFATDDLPNQLTIIKVLQEIGSNDQTPFLVNCLDHPHDEMKAAAARAIRQVEGTGLTFIKEKVNIHSHPWITLIPQLQKELMI